MPVATDAIAKTVIDWRFLADFLRSVDANESVELHLGDPAKPVKLVAGKLVYIIMPMARN